jgi:hypothetical protein
MLPAQSQEDRVGKGAKKKTERFLFLGTKVCTMYKSLEIKKHIKICLHPFLSAQK